MRIWPRSILVSVMVAALTGTTAAPAHLGAVGPESAAKKCRKGQVRVVILKKRTCRSLKKAMPRPRKADRRLLFARAAVGANLRGLRDRRGRRPPSIEKALRRIGPRATQGLQRALPKGLQMLDRLAASRPGARAKAHGAGGRQTSSDTYTFDVGNGVRVDIRVALAGAASMEIAITGRLNGQTVRTRLNFNADQGFRGPDCPTAEGVLEARDGVHVGITTELLDSDGDVDYYYTNIVKQTTKLRGEVDDEAKLKTLDVQDKLEMGEITGGSVFGGTNIESVAKRHTVVDMKTGQYDPGRSDVRVTVAMSGILRIFQNSALAGATQRLQKAADEGFAATVESAMRNYRERETRWNQPNTCAQARLSPASGALVLDVGERGPVTAETSAKDGRKPANAKWTVAAMENVLISPSPAQGNPGSFNFVAGTGERSRGVFRAVSKAGVAEAEWVQPIRSFALTKIAGNFTGSASLPVGDRTGHFSWSGGGTFVRTTPPGTPGAVGSYVLDVGSVSYTASGGYTGGDAVCNMSGSEFFNLPHGSGSIAVTPDDPAAPFKPGPHNYSGLVPGAGPMLMDVTLSDCADSSINGETRTIGVGGLPLDMGPDQQRSDDGVNYVGSHSDNVMGFTHDWSWTLAGSSN